MQRPTLKGIIFSLWFKLSTAFTFIGMVSVTGLSTIFFVLNDAENFHKFVNSDTLTEIVRSERLLISQALKEPGDERWQVKIEEELKSKILGMTKAEDLNFYSIGMGSNPELYYLVTDIAGKRVFQYPERSKVLDNSDFPRLDNIDTLFWENSLFSDQSAGIQIQHTIHDSDGHVMGKIELSTTVAD